MKQTAVEWLIEELMPSIALQTKYIEELKEKAKEMEKQQIIDAANTLLYHSTGPGNTAAEQYYNETYGNKESDECTEIKISKNYEQIDQSNPVTRGSTALVKVTSSQTEISDEDIEKGAIDWYEKERPYKPSVIALKTWVGACKWYKEQLKSKL